MVKEKDSLSVPVEIYVKAGVHLGTRAIMPGMREYVYKRKGDGIAVLNTKKIDERIKAAALFLSKFDGKDIMACCRKEVGYKAIEAFGKATNARVFKKYPAGLITNPSLNDFFEPKVLLVVDPWYDGNAIKDAVKIRIPTIALCDTNNTTEYIDLIVPCNNKTSKSIGTVLYLIAKQYLEAKGEKIKLKESDFY